MKNFLKKLSLVLLLAGSLIALPVSADVTSNFWIQNAPSVLMTNTGSGLANADIHVKHCYIGTGTGTPCSAGGIGTGNIVAGQPVTGCGVGEFIYETLTGTVGCDPLAVRNSLTLVTDIEKNWTSLTSNGFEHFYLGDPGIGGDATVLQRVDANTGASGNMGILDGSIIGSSYESVPIIESDDAGNLQSLSQFAPDGTTIQWGNQSTSENASLFLLPTLGAILSSNDGSGNIHHLFANSVGSGWGEQGLGDFVFPTNSPNNGDVLTAPSGGGYGQLQWAPGGSSSLTIGESVTGASPVPSIMYVDGANTLQTLTNVQPYLSGNPQQVLYFDSGTGVVTSDDEFYRNDVDHVTHLTSTLLQTGYTSGLFLDRLATPNVSLKHINFVTGQGSQIVLSDTSVREISSDGAGSYGDFSIGSADSYLGHSDGTTYARQFFSDGSQIGWRDPIVGYHFNLPQTDGASGYVLTTNGSGNLFFAPAGAGSDWLLTGNAGTTPGTNFLGTTDDQDMIFKRNSVFAGQLHYDGSNIGNTSFGVDSSNDTTTQGLTAIGYRAANGLIALSDGVTALGAQAGADNPTFRTTENSTFVGSYSGNSNQGADVITLGEAAGVANQGDRAIIIGSGAGTSNTGTDALIIGSNGAGNTNPYNNVIILGDSPVANANNEFVISGFIDHLNFPLNSSGGSTGYVLTNNNGLGVADWEPNPGANAWQLSGNAGTDPTTNFLGTTDNANVLFKRDNITMGKLKYDSGPEVTFGDLDGVGNSTLYDLRDDAALITLQANNGVVIQDALGSNPVATFNSTTFEVDLGDLGSGTAALTIAPSNGEVSITGNFGLVVGTGWATQNIGLVGYGSTTALQQVVPDLEVGNGGSGTATVNLPSAPLTGEMHMICDYGTMSSSNNIVLDAGSGNIIRGNTHSSRTYTINTDGACIELKFIQDSGGGALQWKIQ